MNPFVERHQSEISGVLPAPLRARLTAAEVPTLTRRLLKQRGPVELLAYPYGNYDQKIVAASKQTGYKLAMSVKRGGNPFFANAFTLKRDQILERDMATFIKRLKTFNPIRLE